MEKRLFLLIGVLVFSLLLAGESNGPLQMDPVQPYVPGRIVLKLSGAAMEAANSTQMQARPGEISRIQPETLLLNKFRSEISEIRKHRIGDYYIAQTSSGCDIEALCDLLRKEPAVTDASPDYIAVLNETIPNDTFLEYQYGLNNTGQVYMQSSGTSGTSGCDIKAFTGWDWAIGSNSVIIAIIDSGVATDHQDLISKVVPGYDFVDDDDDPYDDNGHGTFVASIAAAETNNGIGMAGVSWNSTIMPIKVMDSAGYGSYLAIATGMRYAVDNGAMILNLSVGGRMPSFILEDASAYCYNKGAVIVASAGNTGTSVLYPAAYDDYCLAVAATDADDNRPAWSNYGPEVDVAAPGNMVFGARFSPNQPDELNAYAYNNGTSFSAPYVAGAVALVMGYKPFLTNEQIMNLIRYTSDDVNADTNPGIDDYIGYGRINLQTLLGPYEINK